MLELTKETYQKEVLESDLPVLVDFWSVRCDKCMDLMPDVERLEEAYSGKVKFGKVDCPKNRRLIASLRVGHMGLRLPGFWFYRDGEVAGKLMGEDVTEEAIVEKLDQLIQE
jgi:thioredoxin 1